ncbi:MAG TPA: hypothetical protein PKE29_03520 [Phycisphaerales bacterium]|nr:hypothetical protein [Phycisphaerales bacterium]
MQPNMRVVSVIALTPLALMALAGRAAADPLTGPSWPIALDGSTQTGQYGPNLLDTSNNPQYFTGFSGGVSVIRAGGYVVFAGNTNVLNTSVNSNSSGVWSWVGANSNVAKITDNPALGGVGTYTTSGIASATIAGGTGQFGFRDNTAANAGLYTNSGTPGRLIKALDTAAGTGGATFSSVGNIMTMNSSGSIATLATLTTGSGSPAVVSTLGPTANNNGFWAGTPGSLGLLVRQGDQLNAPGNVVLPDVLVGGFDSSAYAYTDSGKLLWTGALQGTGVNTTGGTTTGTNQGLFSTRNGYAEVIARRGDSFPDASGAAFTSGTSTDGVAYRSVNTGTSMDMNGSGRVAYSASLRTSAGTTPATGGTIALFSDNDGTLRTLARHTSPVPASIQNTAGDLAWGSGLGNVIINSANTVVFSTTGMTGTGITSNVNNAGVYRVSGSGVYSKVYQGGDAAPAWPAAVSDPSLNQVIAGAAPVFSAGTPTSIAMNSAGQLVFVAGLTGAGINSGLTGNQTGLFAMDTDGSIFLIAQKGMLFHVGPGDDRIVSSSGIGSINQTGNSDGRASNIDDLGNIVFTLSFSDTVGGQATSSGVFYFHIPSPGATALLGMGGLLAARRRRR